ncbi:unnamed protein product, partial [Adineta steineri]
MQLQQIPFYYPVNASGLIQATAGVGQPQNIMIPSASSSAGQASSGLPPLHYTSVYADPRMYSLYSSAAMNPNWQLARSPPQQQQQQQQQQQSTDQQRGYNNGQNVTSQQGSSTGASNISGRSASTSGPSSQTSVGPSITPQYTLNGTLPAGYAYGAPTGWIAGPQQVPSPQTNITPQINPAYNVIYDPSQQGQSQQPTYVHSNSYEA